MSYQDICVNQVIIKDSFWSFYQELVLDTVIPYQEKVLNDQIPGIAKSHAIENFRIAAGLSEGEYYGMVFQDSDVAKWLESAAYALALRPDAELEARCDEVIDIIAAAQQPDGYLNTYFTIKYPERRWKNLEQCHELYCAGHMMEAAVAYYQTTGKRKLLDVMEKMAEHIIRRFGSEPEKEHNIPGHQEVEIGLMRLYYATGKEAYKDMARYFLDLRGRDPEIFYKERQKRTWGLHSYDNMNEHPNPMYQQYHAPVCEQTEAVGHCVRATYMYTAMADLASEDKNEKMYAACRTLWNDIVEKKMFITGGIGSTKDGEAFTLPYDLPNDSAYNETCASIGMVFFAKKMLDIEPCGNYADIMERELYNGILSGMQMDGKRFFYVNPLEVNPGVSGELLGFRHVLPERPEWYPCACCPPNVTRLLASLGCYAWNENDEGIWSHLFIGQKAMLKKADIDVESNYPWEGSVTYKIYPKTSDKFTIALHIPGYIKPEQLRVRLNEKSLNAQELLYNGYLYLKFNWKQGDSISLDFDLPVRRIYANPAVRSDAGCVALMRGPLVYCLEGVDHKVPLQMLTLTREAEIEERHCDSGVLKGMVLLQAEGFSKQSEPELYSEIPPQKEPEKLTAIPYFAWGNRGKNQMRVWIPEI